MPAIRASSRTVATYRLCSMSDDWTDVTRARVEEAIARSRMLVELTRAVLEYVGARTRGQHFQPPDRLLLRRQDTEETARQ